MTKYKPNNKKNSEKDDIKKYYSNIKKISKIAKSSEIIDMNHGPIISKDDMTK